LALVFGPNQEKVGLAFAALLGGLPVREEPNVVIRDTAKTVQKSATESLATLSSPNRGSGHAAKPL
jgi:hypothetical protein